MVGDVIYSVYQFCNSSLICHFAHIVVIEPNSNFLEFSDPDQNMENFALDDLHILNSMMFQNCRSEESKELTITDFARTLRKMADFCSTNLNWDFQNTETNLFKELDMKVNMRT